MGNAWDDATEAAKANIKRKVTSTPTVAPVDTAAPVEGPAVPKAKSPGTVPYMLSAERSPHDDNPAQSVWNALWWTGEHIAGAAGAVADVAFPNDITRTFGDDNPVADWWAQSVGTHIASTGELAGTGMDKAMTGINTVYATKNWALSGALLAANPHYWSNRNPETGNLWNDALDVKPEEAFQAAVQPIQGMLGQGMYDGWENFNIADGTQREFMFEPGTPMAIGAGFSNFVNQAYIDPLWVAGKGIKLARYGSQAMKFGGYAHKSTDIASVIAQYGDEADEYLLHLSSTGKAGKVTPAGVTAEATAKMGYDELLGEAWVNTSPHADALAHTFAALTDPRAITIARGAGMGDARFIEMLHKEYPYIHDALNFTKASPYENMLHKVAPGIPRPTILGKPLENHLDPVAVFNDATKQDRAMRDYIGMLDEGYSPITEIGGSSATGMKLSAAWRAGKSARDVRGSLYGNAKKALKGEAPGAVGSWNTRLADNATSTIDRAVAAGRMTPEIGELTKGALTKVGDGYLAREAFAFNTPGPAVFEKTFQLSSNFRQIGVWHWVTGQHSSGWLTIRGLEAGSGSTELKATFSESKLLRNNPEFTNGLIARWGKPSTTSGKLATHQSIETEAVDFMADHFNVPRDAARAAYKEIDRKRADLIETFTREGRAYGIDPETGKMIFMTPMMRSQLETKVPLIDMSLMEHTIRRMADPDMLSATELLAKGVGFGTNASHALDGFADQLNSMWKAAVLMRLGYTQRNVTEGWLRTLAVLGTIPALSPGNMRRGLVNFWWHNPNAKSYTARVTDDVETFSHVIANDRKIITELNADIAEFEAKVAAQGGATYRMAHTAPGREGTSPMHDIEGAMPDFHAHPEYYRTGDAAVDAQSLRAIKRVNGAPDAEITIYRAVPSDVTTINPHDWVTPSKAYAQQHAEDGWTVLSQKVPARELHTDGNSINEWGWNPTDEAILASGDPITDTMRRLHEETLAARDAAQVALDEKLGVLDDFLAKRRAAKSQKQFIGSNGAFAGELGNMRRLAAGNNQTVENFFMSRFERDNAVKVLENSWSVVQPGANNYFEALHQTVVQMRNDSLATMALQGATPGQMSKWLRTDAGRAYSREMGLNTLDKRVKRVVDLHDMVEDYLPTIEARRLAAQGVGDATGMAPSPGELRTLLGGRDDLNPIHGAQSIEADKIAGDLVSRAKRFPVDAKRKVFQWLGSLPESTLVRQPFYHEVWKRNTDNLMQKAIDQGLDITDELKLSIDQTAHARALKATNDTLFTIQRYSNPAALFRFVSPFFAAWENGFRTWLGIFTRDPSIAARAAQIWDTPAALGLVRDQDGNPVGQNRLDVFSGVTGEHVVFPKVVNDVLEKYSGGLWHETPRGTFNVVSPGESPFFAGLGPGVNSPVGMVLVSKPDWQAHMRDWLGEGAYRQLVPFGTPNATIWDAFKNAVIPPVARKGEALWQGTDNQRFVATVAALTQQALVDSNLTGEPMKTGEQIRNDARSFFKFGMVWSATMPISDTRLSRYQPEIDAWHELLADPTLTYQEKIDAFLAKFGESYLPLTMSTYKAQASGLDSTLPAWKMVTDHAKEISVLAASDPEAVGIIASTALDGDYEPGVAMYWMNEKMPGTTGMYKTQMTAEQITNANRISVMNREYYKMKAVKDQKLADLGVKSITNSKASAVKEWWDSFRDNYMMGKYGSTWTQFGPQAFASRLPTTLTTINTLIHDENFMNSEGVFDSPVWPTIKAYMDARVGMKAQYDAASGQHKKDILTAWDGYAADLRDSSLTFSDFFDTYLDSDDLTKDVASG